jgi:hexosaminidase
VPATWGVFAEVLCPGKPFTFTFVQQVLDEVIALFPAPFVHIGGDEVPKDRWRACASCQAIMRREGLANEDALQRWFTDSIGRVLATRGKRLIGWNEIMHGGQLLPSTVVQSWEDSSWTRRAIEAGHDVIASPNPWTYLDASPRDRPLSRVYEFEPVPPGVTPAQARRVLGGEVPLWSERITSPANLELMAWPRTLAFAEVMWSARRAICRG